MNADRPLVVGIAGKCCAGKDEVVNWLRDHGWQEINVDRIGHDALAALHSRIVATFGRDIVGRNGTIERARLGAVVFSDRAQLQRLEAIVHPWMRARVEEKAATFRADARADARAGVAHGTDPDLPRGLIINAALLFPMHLDTVCDQIIVVTAPLAARVRRARARDGAGWRRILQRLWTQRHLDAQARASSADILMVENGSTREALHAQLARLPYIP